MGGTGMNAYGNNNNNNNNNNNEKEEGEATLMRLREELLQKGYGENGINQYSSPSVTFPLVFSILIASCGSLVCGSSVGYTSSVESQMMADMSLSTAQFSLFGSLLTVGALVGSIISGKLTDYLGRRGAMALSDIFCIAGGLAISLSKVVWSLYVGRLLVGSGIGALTFTVPVYVAELTTKDSRGAATLFITLITSCGISTMLFLGLLVNWRILAIIGSAPCVIQLFGLLFVPESPRWLLKVGLNKKYETALQRLRGQNVDISLEAAEIKESIEAFQEIPDINFISLFQRKYARVLTIVLGLMALGQLCGSMGIICYASSIFESAGFPDTVGSTGLALIQIPFTILGIFLMDKVGRRPLLMVSLSGMGIGYVLAGVSFLLEDHNLLTKFSPMLVFVGLMLFIAAYPFGIGGIPTILMSEMFPMNVKGAAGSIAIVVNWSCAWIVSYAFNFMFEWSSSGTFFVFACVCLGTILFAAMLVPETKGRSLEEIQDLVITN